MSDFTIKDSGQREQFGSGMVRDTEDDKVDYTLIADGPMLERWAVHLTKGAKKYSARNWMKAEGEEEASRARRSLFRHFIQYMRGDTDEDHAAAIFFNVNLIEYVRGKTVKEGEISKEELVWPQLNNRKYTFSNREVVFLSNDHPGKFFASNIHDKFGYLKYFDTKEDAARALGLYDKKGGQ